MAHLTAPRQGPCPYTAIPGPAGRTATVAVVSAQQKVAALYRQRAHQRMTWARAARDNGHPEAVRALVDEARLWARFASDWARKAHEEAPQPGTVELRELP